MIAAIALGQEVLPSPATFDLTVMLVATLIHFVLALIFGVIVVGITYRWSTATALTVGLLLGLVLYGINFYGFTAVFPWFAQSRTPITIITHLVFGFMAAGIYKTAITPRLRQ